MAEQQTIAPLVLVGCESGNDDPLLAVLRIVREAGGELKPEWSSDSSAGYVYSAVPAEVENARLLEDLARLARYDYLERVFFNRITRCPSCSGHHVNTREVCLSCSSADLRSVELLHHYRCGHVAPIDEFAVDPRGRRCPKCRGYLVDRGTDHDVPGPQFRCGNCAGIFQMPEMGTLCLGCGAHFKGAEHEQMRSEDVWAYRLSPLGVTALERGELNSLEGDPFFEIPDILYRRRAFLRLLEDERRRSRHFKIPHTIAVVWLNEYDIKEEEAVRRFAGLLNPTDKIGRFDAARLLVLFPGVDERRAKRLFKEIRNTFNAHIETLALPMHDENVEDAVALAVARADNA